MYRIVGKYMATPYKTILFIYFYGFYGYLCDELIIKYFKGNEILYNIKDNGNRNCQKVENSEQQTTCRYFD